LLHGTSALVDGHGTVSKSGVKGFAEFFTLAKRGQHGEFLRLDAAKVHGVFDSV